ncbi:type I polyketide synthase [Streptomyces otsuchiensis]|uniref:type I polyketide synthase n=1 Tax=Streptomyces otsuchiensis TaxID=2681388 RepID=UPI001D130F7B|nr:type I polyketide synthase [Streptomyces otsuchiensis]
MDALPEGGAMLAVELPEGELELPGGVDLAAVNGPTSVTVSGAADAIGALEKQLRSQGVRVKRLAVSHAFHSSLMEPMLAEFAAVAQALTFNAPQIPVRTTAPGDIATPAYWVGQVREPVRFADAVRGAHEEGATRFVELGPDGVLSAQAALCLAAHAEVTVLPAQRSGTDGVRALLTAVAGAHVAGVRFDWGQLFGCLGGRVVDLPTYAFQHQRYWPLPVSGTGGAGGQGGDDAFWVAVRGGDADAVAGLLGVDPGEDRERLDDTLSKLTGWHDLYSSRGLRYQEEWQPVSVPVDPVLVGSWLVLAHAEHEETAADCAEAIRRSGGTPLVQVIDPADAAAELRQLVERSSSDRPWAGVLSLLGLAEDTAVATGLALVRTLADTDTRLWCVTRGAVALPDEEPPAAGGHALWALGRVAALEHPSLWGGLIDLPTAGVSDASLVAILSGVTAEDQVALRDEPLARRLVTAPPVAATPWRPQGTLLITGGTGALGSRVARWAALGGATRLVLAGRRGASAPGADQLVKELTELGAETTVVSCDFADRDAVASLVAEYAPNAVVHAAGVGGLGRLSELTEEDLAAAQAGKAAGAEHLDELCGDLDAFVLFGSVAAVWGGAGQAAYAAANARLETLALRRAARGAPATCVAFGAWGGEGMAEGADTELARRGVLVMDPDQALAAMADAVADTAPTVTVADIDWPLFAQTFTSSRPSSLLARLAGGPASDGAEVAGAPGDLRADLLALPHYERADTVLELVRTQTALVLGHADSGDIKPDRAFRDLGFDSLTAVEMRNRLTAVSGSSLTATVVFDYPTPAELAEHLLEELGIAPDGDEGEADEEQRVRAALAAVPTARLREAGLLEPLLRLAGEKTEDVEAPTAHAVDELDGEALLKLVEANDGEH